LSRVDLEPEGRIPPEAAATILRDFRSRHAALLLAELEEAIGRTDLAIDPEVEPEELDEVEVAFLTQAYLTSHRGEIVRGLEEVVECLQRVIGCLFLSEPSVAEFTRLPDNLNKIYGTTFTSISTLEAHISEALRDMEYTDALELRSKIYSKWSEVKLMLRHQIIIPLGSALEEEARRVIRLGEEAAAR